MEYQKKGAEEIFEIIITENFQKLMKDLGISDITKQDKYKKTKKPYICNHIFKLLKLKANTLERRQKGKKTTSVVQGRKDCFLSTHFRFIV